VEIAKVVAGIEAANSGSRILDRQIAEAVGWRREIREDQDSHGRTVSRGVWYDPSSGKPGTIPNYSGDLEAAHSLVELIAPNTRGACTWENGAASAKIGTAPYSQARTPALALTSAALKYLAENR